MKTVTKEEVERVFKEYSSAFAFQEAKQVILNELFPPEFKVGDWVVVLEADEFYFNSEQGVAKKIVEVYSDLSETRYLLKFKDGSTHSYTDIRHATPEEIAAATWEANKPYKVWSGNYCRVRMSSDEVGMFYADGTFHGKTIHYENYEKL